MNDRSLNMKNAKIVGVSIWIWLFGLAVCGAIAMFAYPRLTKPVPLEIVKQELWRNAGSYEVRGQIFNPRKSPARNVIVKFSIFGGKLVGTDKMVRVPKGTATAVFNYIPAGSTVDLVAATGLEVSRYGPLDIDPGVIMENGVAQAPATEPGKDLSQNDVMKRQLREGRAEADKMLEASRRENEAALEENRRMNQARVQAAMDELERGRAERAARNQK